jgi:hypothetical protein
MPIYLFKSGQRQWNARVHTIHDVSCIFCHLLCHSRAMLLCFSQSRLLFHLHTKRHMKVWSFRSFNCLEKFYNVQGLWKSGFPRTFKLSICSSIYTISKFPWQNRGFIPCNMSIIVVENFHKLFQPSCSTAGQVNARG